MILETAPIKKFRRNDYPYYRQIWTRVVAALLAASLLPLIAIGGSVSVFTFRVLESRTLDALRQEVRRHQEAIDSFLAERERGLKLVASLRSLPDLLAPGRLETVFQTLRHQMPGFTDLGVIDMQGRHRAYTGPCGLEDVNYSGEGWFRALQARDTYISDVYPGFRKTPHFIMAVKLGQGEDAFILRATVDSDAFDSLVGGGMGGLNAEAFIVNREGLFQTRSKDDRELLTPSGIEPYPEMKEIQLVPAEDALLLTLWQKKVPWLNVVKVQRRDIYAGINRARLAVVITFILGSILIAVTVLLTTGSLVRRLEAKGQRLRILDDQLRRTSFLSASMELAMGFLEEIRDIFANIDAAVKCQEDATGPEQPQNPHMLQIADEAARGHELIGRFCKFVGDEDPVITDVQVNDLLDDLLAFLHRELARRGIEVVRDYQPRLSPVRSDRAKLRQVFQNLVLNAVSALEKGGRILLETRMEGGHITVVIADTGPGISPGNRPRIFEPLFTTRPRGTGLGLTICRTILDQLGGTIGVDSTSGQGAEFTVRLPERLG